MINKQVLNQLHHLLPQIDGNPIFLIAYSGGVDSTVLLDQLVQLSPMFPTAQLQAIHINHQLHPLADEWQIQTKMICDELQIPLHQVIVNAHPKKGESPEHAARNARYQAFSHYMNPQTILFTAHHRDDQAETLLLQLLRGSGLAGLSGMPLMTDFAEGYLMRPLLDISREAILNYANSKQLQWIEDDSNQSTYFDRNYLRQLITPKLQSRWPSLSLTLSRSAKHCFEAQQLIDEVIEQDLKTLLDHAGTLSIEKLSQYSSIKQRFLLRAWLKGKKFLLPNEKRLVAIQQSILSAKPDAQPMVRWKNVIVCRYRDRLFALDQKEYEPIQLSQTSITWHWSDDAELILSLQHSLMMQSAEEGLALDRLPAKLIVMTRQPNQRIKKILQELNIPPWQRWRLLLVCDEVGQLICIPGLWISPEYRAQLNEEAVLITACF